ncbi:hypothetical protein EDB84DRAFT_1462099 [Lactarius hengduanensis]|nr:hypothetical protein EDB84DRAFT_1462099 [Lactarius hengduanensis]
MMVTTGLHVNKTFPCRGSRISFESQLRLPRDSGVNNQCTPPGSRIRLFCKSTAILCETLLTSLENSPRRTGNSSIEPGYIFEPIGRITVSGRDKINNQYCTVYASSSCRSYTRTIPASEHAPQAASRWILAVTRTRTLLFLGVMCLPSALAFETRDTGRKLFKSGGRCSSSSSSSSSRLAGLVGGAQQGP